MCFVKGPYTSASPSIVLSLGFQNCTKLRNGIMVSNKSCFNELCAHSPIRSLCARGYPELELGAEPMPAAPGPPGGLKLSNGGNWKGSETGTRPPNIPKPRGRAEGLPRREVPAVDTCGNKMQ